MANRFFPKGYVKPVFGKKRKKSNYTITETSY